MGGSNTFCRSASLFVMNVLPILYLGQKIWAANAPFFFSWQEKQDAAGSLSFKRQQMPAATILFPVRSGTSGQKNR